MFNKGHDNYKIETYGYNNKKLMCETISLTFLDLTNHPRRISRARKDIFRFLKAYDGSRRSEILPVIHTREPPEGNVNCNICLEHIGENGNSHTHLNCIRISTHDKCWYSYLLREKLAGKDRVHCMWCRQVVRSQSLNGTSYVVVKGEQMLRCETNALVDDSPLDEHQLAEMSTVDFLHRIVSPKDEEDFYCSGWFSELYGFHKVKVYDFLDDSSYTGYPALWILATDQIEVDNLKQRATRIRDTALRVIRAERRFPSPRRDDGQERSPSAALSKELETWAMIFMIVSADHLQWQLTTEVDTSTVWKTFGMMRSMSMMPKRRSHHY